MGSVKLRIIVKLILWELMVIATTDGYNISNTLSSEHLVRTKRASPEILKLRYYDEKELKLVALKKVIDSTVASFLVPICNIEPGGGDLTVYTMENMQPVFYHGVNIYSAITYFPHTNTLHGVIDQSFYVENLPLSDVDNPNVVARFIHPMSNRLSCKQERSRSSRQINPQCGKRKFETNDQGSQAKRLKKYHKNPPRKTLYPEILLTIDTSSQINFEEDDDALYEKVIMYTYAYWNAVDMLFRHLKRTDIRINIAGIFVGTTTNVVNGLVNSAHRYVQNSNVYIQKVKALDSLGRYIYSNKEWERDSFDFSIWMTRGKLTSYGGMHRAREDFAIAADPANCGGIREHERNGIISNRAIIMHDDKYGDYQIAARELAHLMFVSDDDVEVLHDSHLSSCLSFNPKGVSSGIMNPPNECVESSLMWSYCSEIHFEKYASSASSCCLLNYPYRTMGEPNPLKLLTVKSQCECYGMVADNSVNHQENICNELLQCKSNEGGHKYIGFPLDGTKCGDNHDAICGAKECLNNY